MSESFYSSIYYSANLTSGVNDSTTTIPVSTVTGLPSLFPFWVSIDHGLVGQEVVKVTSIASLNLTVDRGESGTSAVSHSSGAMVRHVVPSVEFEKFSFVANHLDIEGIISATLTGIGFLVRTNTGEWAFRSVYPLAGQSRVVITNPAGTDDSVYVDVDPWEVQKENQIFVKKAANEVVTNSTTLQDDNHFTGITFPASSTWECEFVLHADCENETGDIKTLIVFGGGAALDGRVHSLSLGTTTTTGSGSEVISLQARDNSTTIGHGLDDSTTVSGSVQMKFLVTTTTSGTLKLQWAQNTAGGAGIGTTMYAGSYFIARRVA